MPLSAYLPEHMGSAMLAPPGPFVAGSHAELTLTYTAGTFGIDDSGMLKISWRTTSDMAKPQFTEPSAPNYTTVEASNGAKLEYWIDRLNIRPWVNTLLIRVGRGFLRAGETLTVRFGDRRQGSPGLRLQTNCEERFELKVYVDAFATYEFTELPLSPGFALVPGPAVRWKAILPSLVTAGEPFRLAIVAEDLWGNPTGIDRPLALAPSRPIGNLPASIAPVSHDGPRVFDNLTVAEPGDVELRLNAEAGEELARANPLRVVASAPLRRYWGDLHGQSGETVGTNPAESYFRYARDKAFVDIVGHQGNDFQITDAFWQELNRLTAAFDEPGRFVCVPGYEWSGNTGLGGDRNVFYRREGRPIHRSSRILVRRTGSAAWRLLHGQRSVPRPCRRGRRRHRPRRRPLCGHPLRARRAPRARRGGALHLGHVRMAAARRLRARLPRRRRLPQRRPQGQAGCHPSGRLDLRRDRRPHLLSHARADARRAVRGFAPAAALWNDRHAPLHGPARHVRRSRSSASRTIRSWVRHSRIRCVKR